MNAIISTILNVVVTGLDIIRAGIDRMREPLYARYLLRNPDVSNEFVCPYCHHVIENDPAINFCEYCAHDLRPFKVIMPCCGYTSFPMQLENYCGNCGAPIQPVEAV